MSFSLSEYTKIDVVSANSDSLAGFKGATSRQEENEGDSGLQKCKQYNCNTTIFSPIAVVFQFHFTVLQYKFLKTCRLLAAVVRKLVLQLYCACADCCNTAFFVLFYCNCSYIVVVLHLCGPLRGNPTCLSVELPVSWPQNAASYCGHGLCFYPGRRPRHTA